MASKPDVRVVIRSTEGDQYFVRIDGNGWPECVSSDRMRLSPLMTREFAFHTAKVLREKKWDAHVMTHDGVELFAEALAALNPPTQPRRVERVPHTKDGILILPASLDRWCIRFPDTTIETYYSETPDGVFEKLTRLAPHLVPFAEKYVPPPPSAIPAPSDDDGLPPGTRLRRTS